VAVPPSLTSGQPSAYGGGPELLHSVIWETIAPPSAAPSTPSDEHTTAAASCVLKLGVGVELSEAHVAAVSSAIGLVIVLPAGPADDDDYSRWVQPHGLPPLSVRYTRYAAGGSYREMCGCLLGNAWRSWSTTSSRARSWWLW